MQDSCQYLIKHFLLVPFVAFYLNTENRNDSRRILGKEQFSSDVTYIRKEKYGAETVADESESEPRLNTDGNISGGRVVIGDIGLDEVYDVLVSLLSSFIQRLVHYRVVYIDDYVVHVK